MEPRISIITLGVTDMERSYDFYHKGLGFPSAGKPEDGIVFFSTTGTRLALYPLDKLAEDFGSDAPLERAQYPGITLAHNSRKKEEVEHILKLAEQSGGKIVKTAQDTFWGGYGGYFSDPDGYLWEVAWASFWRFDDQGSLLLG